MKIAILSRRPSLYSTQRLKEAAKQRGHDAVIVDYLRCYMDITSHRPQVIYQGTRLEVDAVIPRIAPTPDLQQRLLVDNPLRLYWES